MATRKRGKILPAVPPPSGKFSRVKQLYKWEEHVKTARENIGSVVLAEVGVPVTHINSLRQYKHDPFVTDEGRIAVSYRGSQVGKDGVRRADVYLKWEPKIKEQV